MGRGVISEPEPVSALQLNIQPGRSPLHLTPTQPRKFGLRRDAKQPLRGPGSSYSETKCEHSLYPEIKCERPDAICDSQFRDLHLPSVY